MSETKSPFADFENMFKPFQAHGLDMDGLMATYRKNVEAMTAATRAANEGMQALVKRQAEIIKDALEQMRAATTDLSAAKDVQDLAARQAEVAKQGFEKASANLKELTELMAKSGTESMEIVQGRVNEVMNELQEFMKKAMKS